MGMINDIAAAMEKSAIEKKEYEKQSFVFDQVTINEDKKTINIPAFNPQPHYNNDNGSIYKFCNDHNLNPWEADMIKRIVRCRKKGQFAEDLDKTKDLIDLYKIEYNNK